MRFSTLSTNHVAPRQKSFRLSLHHRAKVKVGNWKRKARVATLCMSAITVPTTIGFSSAVHTFLGIFSKRFGGSGQDFGKIGFRQLPNFFCNIGTLITKSQNLTIFPLTRNVKKYEVAR